MAGFDELLIGRSLGGRYTVAETLGRGGMSVVYKAKDERLGREVAVKVISLSAGTDDATRDHLRERLRREAASSAGIPHHPNVVQVYDYGTDEELDLDFIVMERMRGRDLKDALAAGERFEQAEAARVLLEAARGVAAGHAAGIVHRDVKPGNVFLEGKPGEPIRSVRILDFGIAKALQTEGEAEEDLTVAGHKPHSPAYASPEQLDPERTLTPASDVFQLGLVAYELLTGERPFGDNEREQLARGEPVPPKQSERWAAVPGPLQSVIGWALKPDPAGRPGSAADFAEALTEAAEAGAEATVAAAPAEDETLAAPPPATPPRTRPHRPRRGWGGPNRAALAAGAATVLLVGAALWLIAQGRGGDLPPEVEPTPETVRELQASVSSRLIEETTPEQGPDAAQDVQRVIADLNRAWLDGDLGRHLSHYASRVDFYNQPGYTREELRADRVSARESYDQVEMELGRRAVTFPRPGRARALVDKTWDFKGPEEEWSGEATTEYLLELRGGRWLVVGEDDETVVRSEREEV
ncbi:MAG: serine/threonine-protein kinase [Longimicrobiaceae bacterium]